MKLLIEILFVMILDARNSTFIAEHGKISMDTFIPTSRGQWKLLCRESKSTADDTGFAWPVRLFALTFYFIYARRIATRRFDSI